MTRAVRPLRLSRPVRAGLLTPYFSFFEQRFPADYRSVQEGYAARLLEGLGEAGIDVVASGLVESAESANTARDRFSSAGVDVVVAAATMAAPPSYAADALEGFDGPILIWDDRRIERFESHADEVDATRASSLLGSVMLANVLGRRGRRYMTVSTVNDDPTPVARAIVGAAAAQVLAGARIGLLGGTIPGYGDVVLEPEAAAALGVELVDVPEAVLEMALHSSSPDLDHSFLDERFEVTHEATPLLAASMRVQRFLSAVVQAANLDALALNCHSKAVRWNESLGVVGCLGATLLWASGVPVACTGDAVTAVALMLATRIGGSAQYCEGYAVEASTGELLISSCGMADISLREDGSRARLCRNDLYPGRNGHGCSVHFGFAAGPATILALTPQTAWEQARLVYSVGELTGRWLEGLNGPSGMFTFDRPGAGSSTRGWIDARPAHHLALMRGDRSAELLAAATFLGIESRDLTTPREAAPGN